MFVLDCSVTLAWCYEDETSALAAQVLKRLKKEQALVPMLWHLEVSNALLSGERRHRLTPAQSARFVKLLSELDILTEASDYKSIFSEIMELARTHKLTAYDGVYLHLALREGLPLASFDQELRQAAEAVGVLLLIE